MFRNLLSRSLPVMVAGVVVLAGIGAAMGGNLPFGIQQAVSETASEVGIDMPAPSTTDASAFRSDSPGPPVVVDRTRDVHDAIDGFKRELTAWRTCIVETAPQRGASPVAACGQKPRLDVPRPYDDPLTVLDRGGADDTKPDRRGRPDGAGKPDRAGPPAERGKSDRP